MEKTITLELSKDEICALVTMASAGITMLSMAEANRDATVRDGLVCEAAMRAFNRLSPRGWASMNDRIMVECYIAWPDMRVVRDNI